VREDFAALTDGPERVLLEPGCGVLKLRLDHSIGSEE
jgi:hypothetical protein